MLINLAHQLDQLAKIRLQLINLALLKNQLGSLLNKLSMIFLQFIDDVFFLI